MIDRIETERLRLRPLTRDDLPDLHRTLFADPQVTWDGGVYTLEDANRSLESKQRHLAEHGFGMLAVTDRETGALLGYAGLQHLEDGPEVELGYYLARTAWGKGLATELARELVRVAFEDLALPKVVAVVRPRNTASKRVLAKAGLAPAGLAHHYGEDVERWEATRAG